MNLKYKLFSIALVCMILVLTACQQGEDKDNEAKGTKGIDIETSMLNDNLYTTESQMDFGVILNITNRGYHNVKPSDFILTYSGFDEGLVDLYDAPKTFSSSNDEILFGADPFHEGTTYQVLVSGNVHLPWASQETDFEYHMNLFVKYCYRYKTVLSSVVCIDPSQGYDSNAACKMRKLHSSGGQGAPIVFTEVMPIVTSNKVAFQVYLKNGGEGLAFPSKGIFGSSPLMSCADLERNSQNFAQLTVEATLGGKTVECTPNPAKVDSEGTYVLCSFGKPDKETGAYSAVLNLETEYVYVDSADAPVSITFLKE
jgi:hypothetical protein